MSQLVIQLDGAASFGFPLEVCFTAHSCRSYRSAPTAYADAQTVATPDVDAAGVATSPIAGSPAYLLIQINCRGWRFEAPTGFLNLFIIYPACIYCFNGGVVHPNRYITPASSNMLIKKLSHMEPSSEHYSTEYIDKFDDFKKHGMGLNKG